ncbi:MAG: hypothetical protein P1Q69_12865 [Candidatus Thorarchaeota archaeon]|nr:hypothetical protein [Candidatus Thorarchaeota archaeon]
MARTPIDVYRGLTQTRLGDDIPERVNSFVGQFSDYVLAEERLSVHLSRFIALASRLLAYMNSRFVVGQDDLTIAIDLLDHVTSTTKWWVVDRKEPVLILRPRIRDPREFMRSVSKVTVGNTTYQRIRSGTAKLSRFLEEQGVAESPIREGLYESLVSTWLLLSAFICRSEGRNATSEEDFERAYDYVRIILFYVTSEDFRALVSSRRLATSPRLLQAAGVTFSPGFERSICSSVAAQLEEQHSDFLIQLAPTTPSAARSILTNSLRLLAQLQGAMNKQSRIEETDYEAFTLDSIRQLESMGISPESLDNEASVILLFKKMRPDDALNEQMASLTRRLEGYIVDAAGNRDFLLQNARLIPRIIALLLLVSAGTKKTPGLLSDSDIKRGLILLDGLLNG